MPEEILLEWDERNVEHATRHAVSRREINEMVTLGRWKMFGDTRGRVTRRRLIGAHPNGRLITVVLEWLGESGRYRPITSWPSAPREIRLYWERTR